MTTIASSWIEWPRSKTTIQNYNRAILSRMTTILRQSLHREAVWYLSSIGSPPKLIGRLLCSTWDSSHLFDRRRVEVRLGPSVDLPSSTQSQLGGPCRLGDALALAIAVAARPERALERREPWHGPLQSLFRHRPISELFVFVALFSNKEI